MARPGSRPGVLFPGGRRRAGRKLSPPRATWAVASEFCRTGWVGAPVQPRGRAKAEAARSGLGEPLCVRASNSACSGSTAEAFRSGVLYRPGLPFEPAVTHRQHSPGRRALQDPLSPVALGPGAEPRAVVPSGCTAAWPSQQGGAGVQARQVWKRHTREERTEREARRRSRKRRSSRRPKEDATGRPPAAEAS